MNQEGKISEREAFVAFNLTDKVGSVKLHARTRNLLRIGLPGGDNGTIRRDKFGKLDRPHLVRQVESYIGLTLAQTAHLIPHHTI